MTIVRIFSLLLLVTSAATAQGILEGLREVIAGTATKIESNDLELRADPEARVRPNESIVIQAIVYGESPEGERVRIEKSGVEFSLRDERDGYLSKPFRYQGEEDEQFYQGSGGQLGRIFKAGTAQYALQDSVLYTAPERRGTYKVQAEVEGQSAEIEIRVENGAPSRVKREKTSFDREPRSRHPYRDLAEHYAPYIAQETWFDPKADYLARFDHDGDWKGDNNWENSPEGSSQAYVYYAAMETDTHWFLTYNFFHARDYSDKCVVGTCHENDNEGVFLTIRKDGSRYGELRTMETLAHNNIYSFASDKKIKGGVHGIDGKLEIYDGSHPVVFLEAGGHGAYGSTSSHSYFRLDDGFKSGTGVTYVYRGEAQRPESGVDQDVGYELLEIYDHWWLRASRREGQTFDAYYQYEPFGDRPGTASREIAGSFLGVAESKNKAKPFWGWHDTKTRKEGVLNTGQWGLDPAYGISQNLSLPERVSLRYIYNPYLGVGGDDVSTPSAPRAPARRATPARSRRTPERLSPDPVSRNRRSAAGELEFLATIDGDALIRVQDDRVQTEVLSGVPVQIEDVSFEGALPRAEVGFIEVEKTRGRGDVRLLQKPSRANEYTAIVQVSDNRRGSDVYGFVLRWEE